MIARHVALAAISLDTRILDLAARVVALLGSITPRQLASGLAVVSPAKDINSVIS